MVNPLLELGLPIRFDRIEVADLEPAITACLRTASERLDDIERAVPTYETVMATLDRATEPLDRVTMVAHLLDSLVTTPDWREAYERCQRLTSDFVAKIPLRAPLYAAVKRVAEQEATRNLSRARRRLIEQTLRDFRRHGTALPAEKKRELVAIDVELATATAKFRRNVLDATNAFELWIDDEGDLAGLPQAYCAQARRAAQLKGRGGYRFTLYAPSVEPALTHMDNEQIRERLWRAHKTRATQDALDNRPIVRQILKLRRAKARLLGFRNFADLVLEGRMVGSGHAALDFIEDLAEKTQTSFATEIRSLEEFAKKRLQPWDIDYYAAKQRQSLFDFDEEKLRPFLSLDHVLAGLFEVLRRLFGILVDPWSEAPVWHPGVRAHRLLEATGELIGYFFLDLHPRENKRDGAWVTPLIASVPPAPGVGVVCMNLSEPSEDRPALLSHREVESLFHEFGHLMHHLLSKVEVRSLAGTEVPEDFVEFPSQLLQNWSWTPETLGLIGSHYETGAAIPPKLLECLLRSRHFRRANDQMRQLGLAKLDLALHVHFDPNSEDDPVAFARAIQQAHSPATLPPDYTMITSFHHLFGNPTGYACGYYSYKWAEVLEADAFSRFERGGLLTAAMGREFREKVLEQGNGEDPVELFRNFMGRDPRLEPLLERIRQTP